MVTDTDVILLALQKERDSLHERILQVDRIIKRVQSIDYSHEVVKADAVPDNKEISRIEPDISFPTTADIKIQVLRIFDMIGRAAPLAEIQSQYTNVTGSTYKIREAVRSLYNVGIVKMVKFKNGSRGFLWVKTDWIKDNALMDKYKPVGFDLLYRPETLMFQ